MKSKSMIATAALILLCTTQLLNAQWWKREASPEIHADRKVTFRLKAPNAKQVLLSGELLRQRKTMTKDDNGIWSVTIGPLKPDIYNYSFIVDGLQTIDPANPNIKMGLRISDSMIVIPAPDPAFYEEQDVPRGTLHIHRYKSKNLGVHRGVYVYTPPQYHTDVNKRSFPVLYLLHGSGDNEQGWTTVGRANVIADNLIAAKKAPPMIIAMPFGHAFGPQGRFGPGPQPGSFETELLNEVIPLVEKNYRFAFGSNNRALAGLSMGGFQTLDIGLKHLDTFDYLGIFSAGARGDLEKTHSQGLAQANDKLTLFWIGIGKDDFLFKSNENLLKTLKQNKVKHTARITEGSHAWGVWRKYLHELLPQLFSK